MNNKDKIITKLYELDSIPEISLKELEKLNLKMGEELGRWLNGEISSIMASEKTSEIVNKINKHCLFFNKEEFELFRGVLVAIFEDEKFAKKQAKHELEHSDILEKNKMDYNFGIAKLEGNNFKPFVFCKEFRRFKLEKIEHLNLLIDIHSIPKNLSPNDEKFLEGLREFKKHLIRKNERTE